MVSPGEDLRLVSVPPNGPGKGLLHADIQGKQLRGDLPEELPFSLNRGQRMDQLPLLVFVGEDLKTFWRDFSANLVPVPEQKSRHVHLKLDLIVRWFFSGRAAVCIPRPDLSYPVPTRASDPWNDVGDEIGVDPVDNAGINISHLKQRRSLGVPGTTIDPNHIGHAPGPVLLSDDHGHSRFDVKEDLIRLGCRNTAPTTNHHNHCFSTAALEQMWLEGPGTKSEASSNGLVRRRTPVQEKEP